MPFTDAYDRTIDPKNRIQIPAEFRDVLEQEFHSETFYICPGERPNTLSLYPTRIFDRNAEQLRTEQIAGEDSLAFEQLYYSLASKLEMDKQGRVVLPERHVSLVGLGREVTLAGSNTRIDVWPTAKYREFLTQGYNERWAHLQKFMRETLGRQASQK